MKVIIAGSRGVSDYSIIERAVRDSAFEISEVVSGGALGVDILGERWAMRSNIPTKRFIPEWQRYGKRAGPMRNRLMAEYADALIAVWDGKSRGTKNMIETAYMLGLEVFVSMVGP